MEIRYGAHPDDVKHYDTLRLREEFLIQNLFKPDEISLTYSHYDRIIVGGTIPIREVKLEADLNIKADYFLERRELGLINIGDACLVKVDGKEYVVNKEDGMYMGKRCKEISFKSINESEPAKIYFNSTPAHMTYPTVLIKKEDCIFVELGSNKTSNHRTIRKYILPKQMESCQPVMGLTILFEGGVWNTMHTHTHERRMEVYMYHNLDDENIVFHNMGQPHETRHITVRNEEAIISPSWSIHTASATGSYSFIWGMAGENQDFDDMDHVAMSAIK